MKRIGLGVFGGGDPLVSLLYVFPLLMAYEVGVLFSPSVNGVDFISRNVFAAVGRDVNTYLLVYLGLGVIYLIASVWIYRTRVREGQAFAPMFIESAIYALTLGTVIIFLMDLMQQVTHLLSVAGELRLGKVGNIVITSLGAGVHEEFMFRMVIMGVVSLVLIKAGLRRSLAVTVALLVSAALFSLAHHVGPAGEAFALPVFMYRFFAGAIFGLIFYFRSWAHAVYTHFLYDVYVMVVQ